MIRSTGSVPRAVLCVLAAILLSGCGPSQLEVDNEQGRLDEATPVIEGTTTVGQTFVSHHSRLAAIEVLLVVYGEAGAPNGELIFHLRTDPTSPTDLVTQAFPTGDLTHNQPLRITFAPLPDSRGQSYYFYFEGTPGSQVAVWYNSVDAYGEGAAVFNGQPQSGDLQFKTFYDYSLEMVAGDVLRGLKRHGWLVFPLAGLLLLPGYLALLLAMPAEEWPDPMLQTTLALGLSVALLPLLLLGITLAGVHLTPALFKALIALMAVATLYRLWLLRWRPLAVWREPGHRPALTVFLLLMGLTVILRMLQARELVVPAWVDGVHHTMITQLIARQGRVPSDYRPFLDIGSFIYHFGFHTLGAGLVWLTGQPVPQAVLVMGQALNAAVGVGIYGLTVTLMGTGRSSVQAGRRAAVIAGLVALGVVGTISLMPAYYVTWGRYTQLTGLVVLPAAAMLSERWLAGGERWALGLGGVAVAGLGLVHYRVLVFYGVFIGALLVYKGLGSIRQTVSPRITRMNSDAVPRNGAEAEIEPDIGKYLARAAVLTCVVLLLLSPWITRLLITLVPTGRGAGWFRGQAAFNAVPRGLIDVGYDRVLLRLALLSLLLGLIWWPRLSILIALWVAGAVLAANPNLIGLRETWLLSNATLVITLFLPMAILTGALAGAAADAVLIRLPPGWQSGVAFGMAGVFLLGMTIGAWRAIDIVNPITIIVTKDDMAAMRWIRQNTEPDAGFVTNVRIWQFRAYMGADGGYWIPLLTGRRTLVPPAIYSFGSREYYYQVQDTLERLAQISDAQDPRLEELMQRYDLKYVYLGAKGGQLSPKSFLNHPGYEPIYSNGPVWIFRNRHIGAGASN